MHLKNESQSHHDIMLSSSLSDGMSQMRGCADMRVEAYLALDFFGSFYIKVKRTSTAQRQALDGNTTEIMVSAANQIKNKVRVD